MPGKSQAYHKFMSRVNQNGPNGCWIWAGPRNEEGYGVSRIMGENLAHRVSHRIFKNEIPEGLNVLHRCDNPPCLNPDHLFLGTHKDNSDDKINKGRSVHWNKNKTHCVRGHEFSEENTYWRPEGKRTCRICQDANRAIRKQNKQKGV